MDGSVEWIQSHVTGLFVFVYSDVLPVNKGGSLAGSLTEDVGGREAGVVQLAAVELQADDGEHEDGEEEQQADLQQGDHGLDDGLQHNLQTWSSRAKR